MSLINNDGGATDSNFCELKISGLLLGAFSFCAIDRGNALLTLMCQSREHTTLLCILCFTNIAIINGASRCCGWQQAAYGGRALRKLARAARRGADRRYPFVRKTPDSRFSVGQDPLPNIRLHVREIHSSVFCHQDPTRGGVLPSWQSLTLFDYHGVPSTGNRGGLNLQQDRTEQNNLRNTENKKYRKVGRAARKPPRRGVDYWP